MSTGRAVRRMLQQAVQAQELVARPGVFLLCAPRSGAADLAWALADDPAFWTEGETNFLYGLAGVDPEGRSPLNTCFRRLAEENHNVGFPEFLGHFGRGLERLFQARARGRSWLDPAPENVLIGPELADMFPQAKFLHVVRDGRAVVRSARRHRTAWAGDVRAAAATWSHYALSGVAMEARFPERVLRVPVEQLAADPAAGVAEIQAFLGVEANPAPVRALLKYGLSRSYASLPPDAQGRFPAFDGPANGRWRDWSADERASFAEAAGEAMATLGYWREDPGAYQSVGR